MELYDDLYNAIEDVIYYGGSTIINRDQGKEKQREGYLRLIGSTIYTLCEEADHDH